MQVRVKLYTILKPYGSGKIGPGGWLVLPENETLQGLADHLAIPRNMGKVFLVNGNPRREGWALSSGDEIRIFAFIGGG
jgi:sulfur carrier protein ThiS